MNEPEPDWESAANLHTLLAPDGGPYRRGGSIKEDSLALVVRFALAELSPDVRDSAWITTDAGPTYDNISWLADQPSFPG